MRNQADKQPDDLGATTASLVAILERRGIPSFSLAAKQARLLALLESSSVRVVDEANARPQRSSPPPPLREQFDAQEVAKKSMDYLQINAQKK